MENEQFPVPNEWKKNTLINAAQYEELYKTSMSDSDNFWAKQSERIQWMKPWKKVSEWSYNKPVSIQWYTDGKLNVSQNCVDRHAEATPDKVAIIWEPENVKEESLKISYKELQDSVCRWANLLKSKGVKKGDRVTIYLPMIPEAAYSMLACARIGAIHSVVFGGFSPNALADRINDCTSEYLITADEGWRGGKTIPLKVNSDLAAEKCPGLKHMFVVRHTGNTVNFQEGRDLWTNDELTQMDTQCEPEVMDSEDPLFILYTSGSTGKPKGVLHTSGGYLVYASLTHETIFNYTAEQTYWCAADVGWVTGHSYIVYGPLANGATTLMFEGVPNYPTSSRIWEIIDKHEVNILYTAPTLIRALMRDGEGPVKKTSRKSLKVLGSVGEPINPEAWLWYHNVVGDTRCPIVDTWWQTETGGILITPLPGATDLKPGSATRPFFGIEPILMDDKGQELEGACTGYLCMKRSWPGQMRTVYKDNERFENTYFSQYPGYYYTGDACRRDEDGYLWITGRVDDVLNVSGHRLGTAEIESALVSHDAVTEAAVVGVPHDIKGQGIYAYVTLLGGVEPSDELRKDLVKHVRAEIGPFAAPEFLQWAPGLPKTRSGKIMRRILRKIAENEFENLGDVSTLADPLVVDQLIEGRLNK